MVISNLIENFPTSAVTFQLQQSLSDYTRTFQLRLELFNCILSNFISNFPTENVPTRNFPDPADRTQICRQFEIVDDLKRVPKIR